MLQYGTTSITIHNLKKEEKWRQHIYVIFQL